MKSMRPTDPNFTIEINQFVKCLSDVSDRLSLEENKTAGTIFREHFFADKTATFQSHGFSVKLEFSVNDKNEIDLVLQDVIIYDDTDEWMHALNRLKKTGSCDFAP